MKKLYVITTDGSLFFDEVKSINDTVEHLYRVYDCVDYKETEDCIFLYTKGYKRNQIIDDLLNKLKN